MRKSLFGTIPHIAVSLFSPPPIFGLHILAQDERLDELVPRVVVEKFAKAYIDGYMTLLQHQLLYPPQPVVAAGEDHVLLQAPRAETSELAEPVANGAVANAVPACASGFQSDRTVTPP
jgi:hypothetical protein